MRRTMTEKKGAWVLAALLVAGVHHLTVQDAGDASFAVHGSDHDTPSGTGLVATRDVSALWPIAAMPSIAVGPSASSGVASIDSTPTFESRVGVPSLEQGPSQGR